MMMPFELVVKASRAAKREAIRNRRRRPATRVRLYMEADTALYRWLGAYMVQRYREGAFDDPPGSL